MSKLSHRLITQTFISVFVCLSAVFGAAGAANADIKLIFGTYAADKPSETVSKFRPLLDTLETLLTEALGEPVKISTQVARTYDAGIDDLVTGRVDFARFGPASYILAKYKQPKIQLLAIESEKGKKTFRGIICVHADSKIGSVTDLKGGTFAFGSERSTIGRFLSQLYLFKNGVKSSDLAKFSYLGRHDSVGMAVGRGDYDAGALKESTFKKMVAKGIPIRELASFPNVTKPWIARSALPDRITKALRTKILTMTDKTALKSLKKDGFLDVTDADYDIIRQAITQNTLFFE